MPSCQLGDNNGPAMYRTQLGNAITIGCPFIHYCDGQCTIDHYNNQSEVFDEVSRGACRTTININNYNDGGLYKCGCNNNTINVTQCVHNVQGEISSL